MKNFDRMTFAEITSLPFNVFKDWVNLKRLMLAEDIAMHKARGEGKRFLRFIRREKEEVISDLVVAWCDKNTEQGSAEWWQLHYWRSWPPPLPRDSGAYLPE